MNAQTTEQSFQDASFQMECIWSVPLANGQTSGLHRKWVRFDDLTLDPSTQRGFYFDFDAALKVLQQQEQVSSQELRDRFEHLRRLLPRPARPAHWRVAV